MSENRGSDTLAKQTRGSEPAAKKRFLPNLKNAINKTTIPNKPPKRSFNGETNQPARPERVRKPAARDNRPQFVQSYSIFETGLGCAVKPQRNAVELREVRTSVSTKEAVSHNTTEIPVEEDILENRQSFITDIKQAFKDAPILMQDSAAGVEAPVDPLKTTDLSGGRNHRLPHDFFSDSYSGRLFSLHLPDKLLPPDPDQIKCGPFGKIQLLDNHQARLVVGEASFELVSSCPLATSSDVVLVERRADEHVRLNCVGHLEQTMLAVPNLENFVRIGESYCNADSPDR